MRTLLLLGGLLAVAATLFFLVMEEGPVEGTDILEFEGPTEGRRVPGEDADDIPEARRRDLVVVVPVERWNVEPDDLVPGAVNGDERLRRRMYQGSDTDGPWRPTGAEVLAQLEKHARGDLQLKFQSEEAAEAFRSRRWDIEVPSQGPLEILMETVGAVGFEAVPRVDGIYMVEVPRDGG